MIDWLFIIFIFKIRLAVSNVSLESISPIIVET